MDDLTNERQRISALCDSLERHCEAWVTEWARDTLPSGETQLSFEFLCDAICDGEIGVTASEVAEIESLGEYFHSKRRAWRHVRELLIPGA